MKLARITFIIILISLFAVPIVAQDFAKYEKQIVTWNADKTATVLIVGAGVDTSNVFDFTVKKGWSKYYPSNTTFFQHATERSTVDSINVTPSLQLSEDEDFTIPVSFGNLDALTDATTDTGSVAVSATELETRATLFDFRYGRIIMTGTAGNDSTDCGVSLFNTY